MLMAPADLVSFWVTPWSTPFRAACLWFTLDTQPLRGRKPDSHAPNWLRPLLLQRWVGKAVAERLAWLQTRPGEQEYRSADESEPTWTEDAWASYDRRWLRAQGQAELLRAFNVEVERLLRIAQEHPGLVGDGDWTGAALGVGKHIAQVYHELRRRHNAVRARYLLREELRHFVIWDSNAEAARP